MPSPPWVTSASSLRRSTAEMTRRSEMPRALALHAIRSPAPSIPMKQGIILTQAQANYFTMLSDKATGVPESEDCLNLNIWKPTGHDKPLPVLIFIHGGGFVLGSNNVPGADLVSEMKDVIFVTLKSASPPHFPKPPSTNVAPQLPPQHLRLSQPPLDLPQKPRPS